MRNKLISSVAASSLIGGSLLFASPAQASVMCLDLSTYRYIEMDSYADCRAYNSAPDIEEPVEEPVEEVEEVTDPDPTPTDEPEAPVVDEVIDDTIDTTAEAEEVLEDDALDRKLLSNLQTATA